MDGKVFAKKLFKGTWLDIALLHFDFDAKGVRLEDLFKRKVGMGDKTYFWKDRWCSDLALKDIFPNIYSIESDKDCRVLDRVQCHSDGSVVYSWGWKRNFRRGRESEQNQQLQQIISKFKFNQNGDCWGWNGSGSKQFSTAAVRSVLSKSGVGGTGSKMVWINWVPLKINCFIWKFFRDRIPTLVNLSKRAVAIGDNKCRFCYSEVEDREHVFFRCSFAKSLWSWVATWSNCIPSSINSADELWNEVQGWKISKVDRNLRLSLLYTTIWIIWKARNSRIFNNDKRASMCFADDIVSTSFSWLKNRVNLFSIDWFQWCSRPIVVNSL